MVDRAIKLYCENCKDFPKDIGITNTKNFIVIECKDCGTSIKLDYPQ